MTPDPAIGPAKVVVPRDTSHDHIGLGRAQAVTGEGTQRAGRRHRRRPGIRLRLTAIPDLTPRGVLREPLFLPCILGPDLEESEEALHTEFDTVSAGQFSSPAGGKNAPQLKAISFDTLSLTWDAKWLVFPDTTPEEVREELEEIIRSRKPIEMFAYLGPHGQNTELRMYATLRGIRRILRHGETDTRYYSLDWKQYRSPVIRRRGLDPRASKLPAQHKLGPKDTLRSLSNRYYGTPGLWEYLAGALGIKKWGGDDPLVKMSRYKEGDKIKIPQAPTGGSIGRAQKLTGSKNGLRIARS